jgi:hypothetical protein
MSTSTTSNSYAARERSPTVSRVPVWPEGHHATDSSLSFDYREWFDARRICAHRCRSKDLISFRRVDRKPRYLGPKGWHREVCWWEAERTGESDLSTIVRVGPAVVDRIAELDPIEIAVRGDGWNFDALLAGSSQRSYPDAAIKHLTEAMRLSPLDPLSFRAKGGMRSPIFLLDGMTRRSRGQNRRFGSGPIILLPSANWRPPVHLAGTFPKHRRRWRICGRSTQPRALALSKIGSHFAGPMTLRDCRKVCDRQGCRSDHVAPDGSRRHIRTWQVPRTS